MATRRIKVFYHHTRLRVLDLNSDDTVFMDYWRLLAIRGHSVICTITIHGPLSPLIVAAKILGWFQQLKKLHPNTKIVVSRSLADLVHIEGVDFADI